MCVYVFHWWCPSGSCNTLQRRPLFRIVRFVRSILIVFISGRMLTILGKSRSSFCFIFSKLIHTGITVLTYLRLITPLFGPCTYTAVVANVNNYRIFANHGQWYHSLWHDIILNSYIATGQTMDRRVKVRLFNFQVEKRVRSRIRACSSTSSAWCICHKYVPPCCTIVPRTCQVALYIWRECGHPCV